jgi:hypothetical protein
MTSAENKTPGVSQLPIPVSLSLPLPSEQVTNRIANNPQTKIPPARLKLTLPLRRRLRKPLPRMSPPIVVFRLPGVQHGLFECGGVVDV